LANKDYSKSAKNLCNPPELEGYLMALRGLNEEKARYELALSETDLAKQIDFYSKQIDSIKAAIKELVRDSGSYQDLDAGLYAIQQIKRTVTYMPSKVKEFLPDYKDAIVKEFADGEVIAGLLKAKLIDPKKAELCEKVTESEDTFIIKAEPIGNEVTK
jgi:hypothetical protein